MADTKLSALTELAATPADDDEVYIRDVSEPAASESKRITMANLLAGAAGDNNIFRERRAGVWHSSGVIDRGVSGGKALVANQMFATPFFAPIALTLTDIGVDVMANVSGSARLGIYTDNGSQYPGVLLLDAGTVSTSTTGEKIISINQVLSANTLYWLVIISDATASVRSETQISQFSILGSPAMSNTQSNQADVSQAFGVLPDPFTGGGTYSHVSEFYRVAVKF